MSDTPAKRGGLLAWLDTRYGISPMIEFLRESRFGKEGFPVFLERMGRTRRSEVEAIEAVFEEVYGEDLEGIDEQFMAYCKKR